MNKIFALADCNNFFASCERVFNPALRGKPVVVLSNNDGCVIARSNEAKAIGIGMGEPYFKCKALIERHNVFVYSANFVLYGDISARVMNTLAQFTPNLEIYSIDEAFLSLEGLSADPLNYAQNIRKTIKRNIGMPVSIGLGSTKTLAKLANLIAKKKTTEGVFHLNAENTDVWLEKTSVEDIWGIGRKKSVFLRSHGIINALQLKNAPDSWVQGHLSIVTLKTVWELRGISCLGLEEAAPDKKSITTSRTFGKDVDDLDEIMEAVSSYTGRAAEKLREQDCICGHVQVYITTNRFKSGYEANSVGIDIAPPTAYTPDLIAAAKKALLRMYKPDHSYKQVGVILSHIKENITAQDYLFEDKYTDSRKNNLMSVMDAINRKKNSGKIFIAAEGIEQPWSLDQTRLSKRFTTRWDELLEIRI